MKHFFAIAILASALSLTTQAQPADPVSQIKVGMPENQVVEILGRQPDQLMGGNATDRIAGGDLTEIWNLLDGKNLAVIVKSGAMRALANGGFSSLEVASFQVVSPHATKAFVYQKREKALPYNAVFADGPGGSESPSDAECAAAAKGDTIDHGRLLRQCELAASE